MLQSKGTPAATGEWECMECGYIEEGTELERPAKCPECNATSDAFEFFSYDEEEWDSDLDEDEDDEDGEEDFEDEIDNFDGEDEDYEELEDDDFDQLDDDR